MSQESKVDLFNPKRYQIVGFIVVCLTIHLFIYHKYGNISGSDAHRLVVRLKEKEICRKILEIRRPFKQSVTSNKKLESAMEEIATSKHLNNFIQYYQYDSLSQFVPSVLKEVPSSNGSSNFTIIKESRLNQINWKIPYLPCRLRKYRPDDVFTCINKREKKGKMFRITAVGDSRIRRLMEYLTIFLNRFNFTIKISDKTDITFKEFRSKIKKEDSHYQENFNVQSSSLPTFLIKFIWAPSLLQEDPNAYSSHQFKIKRNRGKGKERDSTPKIQKQIHNRIDRGIVDELRRLLKQPREELPDMMIFDTGLWLLTQKMEDILINIEKNAFTMALTLHNALEELASRMAIILLLPHPIKDFGQTNKHGPNNPYWIVWSNKNLKWHLNAQIELFPKNILIWDSFLPIAMASNRDCITINQKNLNVPSLPQILDFSAMNAYACNESGHVGYEVLGIAVQMLLNQICNSDMENYTQKSYCCEG